eukprot:3125431-Pyramimonas_sp.AAC.1
MMMTLREEATATRPRRRRRASRVGRIGPDPTRTNRATNTSNGCRSSGCTATSLESSPGGGQGASDQDTLARAAARARQSTAM